MVERPLVDAPERVRIPTLEEHMRISGSRTKSRAEASDSISQASLNHKAQRKSKVGRRSGTVEGWGDQGGAAGDT